MRAGVSPPQEWAIHPSRWSWRRPWRLVMPSREHWGAEWHWISSEVTRGWPWRSSIALHHHRSVVVTLILFTDKLDWFLEWWPFLLCERTNNNKRNKWINYITKISSILDAKSIKTAGVCWRNPLQGPTFILLSPPSLHSGTTDRLWIPTPDRPTGGCATSDPH